MTSRAVASFWDDFKRLPTAVQARAVKQYRLWHRNPHHPSLRFKKVGSYWSVRVTNDYRAVGILDEDVVVWFFIGSHAEYDRLLKGL